MAESARQLPPEEDDASQPERPFELIQGGGESTEPKTGHLKPVDNPVYDPDPVDEGPGGKRPKLRVLKGGGGDSLKDQESKAGADKGAAAPASTRLGDGTDDESDFGTWKTNVQRKLGNNGKKAARAKIFALTGGLGLGLGVFGVSLLLPYKLSHFIENIERKVGQIPANVVERRVEHYINRYLITKALEKEGVDMKDENNRFTYVGNGIFRTLYVNWEGAKLEAIMERDYGFRVVAKPGTGHFFGRDRVMPDKWQVEDLGVGQNNPRRFREIEAKEMRSLVREFQRDQVHSHQLIKRMHMRIIQKKYFGINSWHPFQKTAKKYHEAKLKFKKFVITQTLGRVSQRYGDYLKCILDGGDNCKRIRQGNTADVRTPRARTGKTDVDANGNPIDGGAVSSQAANKQLGDITSDANKQMDTLDPGDKEFSKTILRTIRSQALKKILGTFAAGIGIIDTLAQIATAMEDGSLSTVLYNKNGQQYVAFMAAFFSAEDQVNSGHDFDPADARVANEVLDFGVKSPVYQTLILGNKLSGPVQRDCNQDGDIDSDETLPEGEVTCDNQKLIVDPFSFTRSPLWQNGVQYWVDLYNDSIGRVWKVLDSIVGAFTDLLGIDDIMGKLLEMSGFNDLISKAFEVVMNWIFGASITGAEEDEWAMDNIIAGHDVQTAAYGGDIGQDRADTIGGAYMSDAEVATYNAYLKDERNEELKRMNTFARLFSPENVDSLTSYAVAYTPSSIRGFGASLRSLLSSGFGLNQFGSLLTATVSAQQPGDGESGIGANPNPFEVLRAGYPVDHEALTMHEEDLHEKYQCDKPPSERPQNKSWTKNPAPGVSLPIEVLDEVDPCRLEERVMEAGSKFFTNDYDAAVTGGGTSLGGGGINTGLQSPPGLGAPDSNGYYRMPDAPGDEYSIYSSPGERCGSKALIDMLWSSGLWWKQNYPGEQFMIGDLNATGHKSHKNGVDVDIVTSASTESRVSSDDRTTAYAMWMWNLKSPEGERIVKEIYYNVPAVIDAVAAQTGTDSFLYYQPGHFDHFHIRIADRYRGPTSYSCGS